MYEPNQLCHITSDGSMCMLLLHRHKVMVLITPYPYQDFEASSWLMIHECILLIVFTVNVQVIVVKEELVVWYCKKCRNMEWYVIINWLRLFFDELLIFVTATIFFQLLQ